ncbi:uncharacterized protein LOC142357677 [Convolutriloba macropyga]|uniref:uncharacterized protein LOC142357677 n=1 Tax=Convolutriloba macropyga TaxID=536237 RepID=UPI003F5226DD
MRGGTEYHCTAWCVTLCTLIKHSPRNGGAEAGGATQINDWSLRHSLEESSVPSEFGTDNMSVQRLIRECWFSRSPRSAFRPCVRLQAGPDYRRARSVLVELYAHRKALSVVPMAVGGENSDSKTNGGPADSEKEAYDLRKKESAEAGIDITSIRPPQGGDPPPPGQWEWTLNWDYVHEGIIVGSCPRDAKDMKRLVKEAGVEAVVCLQSDDCHKAMGIDWIPVVNMAHTLGVFIVRVPVRDFDRLDQALMLPEMCKMIGLCRALGLKTYVHCTAGINRANLSVVAYLIWMLGMDKEEALALVRRQRPQANPYMVSFETARTRMLSGREQDVYIQTQLAGNSMEDGGDWVLRDWTAAENAVIEETIKRQASSCMCHAHSVYVASTSSLMQNIHSDYRSTSCYHQF